MRRPATRRRTLARPFLALLALAVLPAAAGAAEDTDLREFRVGMPVSALPATGYKDLACAAQPDRALSGWADWRSCPVDPTGLHAVSFRYDDAFNDLKMIDEDEVGTKVGGHPVLLQLLIGDDARVDGLRIDTDPKARLYLRKKAFLFGRQVMERFGEEGWRCTEDQPAAGEEPLGGVFLKEHCEKTTPSRRYVLDRQLYRRSGEELRDFVGGTQFAILRNG